MLSALIVPGLPGLGLPRHIGEAALAGGPFVVAALFLAAIKFARSALGRDLDNKMSLKPAV
ncbi:MAG TPA: hypothetical protein VMH89_14555 [Candidatus Acidoferrum sp.]|nr:hypothetical protein [Candidatus Acidoferrum sp.]